MKKLILSAAIVLGSMSTYAVPVSTTGSVTKTISIQDEYTEVKEVPSAVKTAIKTAYPDAVLEKASVNAKKEYKLEIAVGDQKSTVYSDANGTWIKK